MDISILLVKQIVGLFFMIFMGFFVVKLGVIRSEDSKVISKVVMYILMPCVIINAFQIDYTPEILHSYVVTCGAAILIHVVWLILTPFNRKVLGLSPVEAASALYPNTGNMIVPLVAVVLGEEYLLFTTPTILLQTILLWTHGVRLVSGEKEFSLKKIFSNVNLIAVIIGLILFVTKFRFPSLISETLSSVASTIGPITMIVTGMLMGGIDFKKVFLNKRVYLTAFTRLVFFAVAALLLLKYLPFRNMIENGDTIFFVLLLGFSAPAAVTITQMAQVYSDEGVYAGAINVVTTVLCIVTMPIMAMLYYL